MAQKSGGICCQLIESELYSTLPPLAGHQLEFLLPDKGKRFRGEFSDHLYLELLGKEKALPIVKCKWDFTKESEPYLCIRVMLLKFRGRDSSWSAIGFRLDSPDYIGAGGSAPAHPYWHVQWIDELNLGGDEINKITGDGEGKPPWLPDGKPAIPVLARDCLDALVFTFVSLYGVNYVKQMLLGASRSNYSKVLMERLGYLQGQRD